MIGVPIASLLPSSRDVAEVLRKSHRLSGLVGAVVDAWAHLPFEMCPRNRIKRTLEAGLADHVSSIEEIVGLLDSPEVAA